MASGEEEQGWKAERRIKVVRSDNQSAWSMVKGKTMKGWMECVGADGRWDRRMERMQGDAVLRGFKLEIWHDLFM